MSLKDPMTDRIIYELNRFRDLVPAEGYGRYEWTAGVKNALLCAGRHFGCNINTTIEPGLLPEELQREYQRPDFGGWLHDVSIQKTADDGRWSTLVVAESEWDRKGFIQEDFEKLVVSRAALRVMVYDGTYAKPTDFRGWIERHEENCPGDTYLMVEYQGTAETRHPLRYWHIVVREDCVVDLLDV